MAERPPLADRMRPQTLDEVVGHERWLAAGSPLRQSLEAGEPRSMVLFGPPGCGKTSIARVLAHHSHRPYLALSAVLDGVKELRGAIERAEAERRLSGRGVLLFVDEVHRWTKGQQDALLPHLESGLIVLVGATTENPSFELNAALRSRLQIIRLEPLTDADVLALLERSLVDTRGFGDRPLRVSPEVLQALVERSAGDARRALTDLEQCVESLAGVSPLDLDHARRALSAPQLRHDRNGDDHYQLLSALIKSLRGSDPDASLYWLARLLSAGEDPITVARRLIIFASEDVGNADPRALQVAVAAQQAVHVVGMPEGRIVLAQAVTWLACSPKSNAAYLAIGEALSDVEQYGALSVPPHLRNQPGDAYLYPHDFPGRVVRQQYAPDRLQRRRYYKPSGQGEEKIIAQRLLWWEQKKDETG
jgi:putative ATPase